MASGFGRWARGRRRAFFVGQPEKNGWDSPGDVGTTTLRIELFCDDPDAVVARALAKGTTADRHRMRTHQMTAAVPPDHPTLLFTGKEKVMKKFAILSIAIALFVSGVLAQSPEPTKNHEWLKQLVGQWDGQFKMYMQPDQPPAEAAGTDSVRALGDHWVVAETKTTMMGAPFSGILSLGYDPQKKRFHGTWIDSMGGYLWVYKGTLNDAGDTLTLETEGPSMQAPNKTARYKEVIQITGKDSRTFTSSIETDDGTWMKILTVEYHRKTSPQLGADREQSQTESKGTGENQLESRP